MKLIDEIKNLKNSKLRKTVDKRLKEFESFKDKNTKEWFSELCFCILTANSKAVTGLKIQDELKSKGFCEYSHDKIKDTIRKNKHRFHNNKAKYIICAREHIDIKDKIISLTNKEGEKKARQWLADNIKGLGFKEASHFMRNVGYKKIAIIDRHILRVMKENKLIKEIPKSITRKKYIEIEDIFNALAKKLNMNSAELDLYMWFMKTGKVLK